MVHVVHPRRTSTPRVYATGQCLTRVHRVDSICRVCSSPPEPVPCAFLWWPSLLLPLLAKVVPCPPTPLVPPSAFLAVDGAFLVGFCSRVCVIYGVPRLFSLRPSPSLPSDRAIFLFFFSVSSEIGRYGKAGRSIDEIHILCAGQ